MNDPPPDLAQFLARYDDAVQSLTYDLRAMVVRELAPCCEHIFEMRSKVMLLYGTSERVISDGICSIGVFHRHVTLTFVEGVDLQDPGQLLRGAGKTMRHLRVASSADLDRKEVPQVPAPSPYARWSVATAARHRARGGDPRKAAFRAGLYFSDQLKTLTTGGSHARRQDW